MKKSYDSLSGLKFVIFLLALGVVIYLMFIAFNGVHLDNEINKANEEAKTVYNAAENWLVEKREVNVKLSNKFSGQELIYISESKDSLLSEKVIENSIQMNLSGKVSDFFDGYWVVVVDAKTSTIKYVLWSENEITEAYIKKYDSLSAQRDFNKETDIIIGCYVA